MKKQLFAAWFIVLSLVGFGISRVLATSSVSIPDDPYLFVTTLDSNIGTSDTSMTLHSGTLKDGSSLTGKQCFTIDTGTATAEFVCGTASGTSITAMLRGSGPLTPSTSVASLVFAHRRGADVRISDFPGLQIQKRLLNGQDPIPNILFYDSTIASSTLTGQNLASVNFVNGVALQGAPTATTTVPGVVQIGTPAQMAAGTGMTGTYTLVPPGSLFNKTWSSTTIIPVTNATGTLDSNFIDQTANYTWSGTHNFTGTLQQNGNPVNGQAQIKAAEALTAGQAVVIGNASSTLTIYQPNSSTNTAMGNNLANWAGETFTSAQVSKSITKVTVNLTKSGSPTGTFTVSIYGTTSNLPSGAALISSSTSATNLVDGYNDFTFASPLSTNASTTYAVVGSMSTTDGSNFENWNLATTNPYANGEEVTSNNSGSTWAATHGSDLRFMLTETLTVAGQASRACACSVTASSTEASDNFIGFVASSVATGAPVSIITSGTANGLTGLTPGLVYYLSSTTAGSIYPYPATLSRKVGISASSTAIILRLDNP